MYMLYKGKKHLINPDNNLAGSPSGKWRTVPFVPANQTDLPGLGRITDTCGWEKNDG